MILKKSPLYIWYYLTYVNLKTFKIPQDLLMQKKTADYVKQTIALANRNGSVSNGEEEADSEKDMPKSITDPIVSIIEFEWQHYQI